MSDSRQDMGRLTEWAGTLLLAAGTVLAACGGSEGGPAGPPAVSRVEISAPSPTLEVGSTMLVSARYFDANGRPLSGRRVIYSSSNATVATVDSSGLVTGVSPGSAAISATVDRVTSSVSITVVPVPVAAIQFAPARPSVRPGETVTLTATPLDAIGRPLSGRAISWSSSNPTIATVDRQGVVTGVSTGTTYIRAEVENVRDSVSLRVKSLFAPVITGTSSGTLVPGGVGTITGNYFGASASENEVWINGVRATVTSGSTTSVTFVVPAAASLPCTPTGPAQILLVANGDTATTTMPLRMATSRSLQVGESLLLTTQDDVGCNEFPATGGRYLITAFNFARHAGVRTSFQLLGASPGGTAVAENRTGTPALSPQLEPRQKGPAETFLETHLAFRSQDRALARSLGSPRIPLRTRRAAQRLNLAMAVNPPPAVGAMVTYRMPRTLGSYSTYDEVRFRVVYVGSKIVILEDSLAPYARTMDQEYVRIGEEFDQVMYPILLAFGDPLVVDSALDNNGHLLALFSKKVNDYTYNGQRNVILGFVTLCDFFPRTPQIIGGVVIPACPASNEAEAFYGLVPEPGGYSIEQWRRYMRSTFIHEAKHIASYAWRYYYDAEELEDTWLEEATAQQASEMWARWLYGRQQFQDIRWIDGPRCDFAPISAACPDPAEGILHHFSFLYDHYNSNESKSILDDPNAPPDPVIYGSSWSFARWVTDIYGGNEASFLSSIVQVKNDHGIDHISARAGRPFSELLGLWSLASLADNYPGATIVDARLQLPSWNSRDLFAEMNRNLVRSGGQPAFPRAWPLNVRQVTFGNFSPSQSMVNLLPGGGFAAWELSGAQSTPQVLAVRAPDGGPPPPAIGMAIVRIQ
ncbi:MAG TPA: Ig-like domain-containing protein [Gemmatimonadaceae bacterium]|nr:Ig-like domain-containing protein [Gemmatimonadaceae bacterium]